MFLSLYAKHVIKGVLEKLRFIIGTIVISTLMLGLTIGYLVIAVVVVLYEGVKRIKS